MKVIIVSLNSQYIHSSLASWYLLSSAKACCKDVTVKVIEGTVNENIDDILNRINTEKADIVAFSCYIWNINYVLKLCDLLKDSKVVTILGGPEVSYCSEKLLKENKGIDYILSGEGEIPFVELLNAIKKGSGISEIKSLSYKTKNGIVCGIPYIDSSIPINPYSNEYFKALKGRIAYLETSRGCPFNCAFCLSGRCSSLRFFPTERAKQDIITLANSSASVIKLVDRTFNANPDRAFEIFEFIITNYNKEIKEGTCFHFEIAGDLLREKDFKLLKRAPKGLIQFEIGMQSFNSKTLSAVNRKTDIVKLKSNILKLTQMDNIHIHIDLIAGLPYEDLSSFRDSFNIGFSLGADMLQLGFLKLLHGADMRENPEKYPCEFNDKAPYEVTGTPWLSSDNVKMLKFTENALERFVNSGRFKLTNNYIFNVQKRNPFDTLTELGMFTGIESCSLNQYVDRLFCFFEKGSDSEILRDVLLLDVASSVKSNVLPLSLKRNDKKLRKFKQFLESNDETKRKKGVLRNVFLLYSENCGAYVDYTDSHDGKYEINKIDFDM